MSCLFVQSRGQRGEAGGAARRRGALALLPSWWLLLALGCGTLCGADTLNWDKKQNRVSADIRSATLDQVLGRVASATGWQVFVEPQTQHQVSAKFKNLRTGEALRELLGDVGFALVPQTNGPPKLLVFHTSARQATQLVPPARSGSGRPALIANELIVRLKPGGRIEEVARQLGAKVVGRVDGLNAYRLQFDDAAAAAAARGQLAANPEVAAVGNNYLVDAPPVPDAGGAALPAPPHLELKPPPDNGRIIIGLIDTAVQPLGNGLDAFMLKQISVAGQAQLDPNSPSHGTSMAETMLQSLQDLTKGQSSVQIQPVDVYGPNESTTTFDLAKGIQQAVDAGARIVNLSLGGEGESGFLHAVIQDATSKGIVFFGAAGNDGTATPFYPAAYPEVNAVTAVDQGQLAPYANRGGWVAYGAPGTSIVDYGNQAWAVTGTSTATAYLSGVLAGYLDSTHSSLTAAQQYLRTTYGVTLKAAGQ